MSGSVMPLAGRIESDTPILMKACRPMTNASPAPASCAKGSRDRAARSSSRIVTRSDSGLEPKAENRRRKHAERHRFAGNAALELIGQKSRGQNRNGGLQEFRGLKLETAQCEPSMRAVHVHSDKERHNRADESQCEH